MNYTTSLLKLYEANKDRVGIEESCGRDGTRKAVLVPPYHDLLSMKAEVVLTSEGDLVEIHSVPDDDAPTAVPVYQPSRSSGISPMALCERLDYLCPIKKKEKRHEQYMEKLKAWKDSEFSHPILDAVYAYLKKETLWDDITKAIPKGIKQETPVRFTVLFDKETAHCWTDRTLQENFVNYIRSLGGEMGMDFLTGEEAVLADKFPKRVRGAKDNTTLISSNRTDFYDLVFTGIFSNKEQAFSVGSESSYKMLNALRWAIRTKGKLYGSEAVAVWCDPDIPAPTWDSSTYDLEQEISGKSTDTDESDVKMDLSENVPENETEESKEDTVFSEQQVIHMLDGYRKKMPVGCRMTLLAVDTPSKENNGRCSIVNHVELDGNLYLDNVERWHVEAGWVHSKFVPIPNSEKERKGILFTGVPGINDVSDLVYGTEINGSRVGFGEKDSNNRDMFRKKTAQQLIPCIWYNRPIPTDLVQRIVTKASYPLHYNYHNWERVVMLACSFYKKYLFDKEGRLFDMALDTTCTDRSYLFGRLLAVADFAERVTYDPVTDKKRETNARRYTTKFVQKPATIMADLRQKLIPYLRKNEDRRKEFIIEPKFNEITSMIPIEEYNDTRLSPLYLLGYDSQMRELRQEWYTKRKKKGEEKTQEES